MVRQGRIQHRRQGRSPRQAARASQSPCSQALDRTPPRILIRCPPVRGEAEGGAARLPRGVGADVADPLVLRKVATGAKTEGGDQLLFVSEPEPYLAVKAAAGQPPVRQHREGMDRAAV